MATQIITKNSSTAAAIPTSAVLVQGELAVNVTDKRLFTENASAAIVELGTNPSALTCAAVTITGGTVSGITDLAVADGGTGASTAANARTNLSAAASGANSDITSLTGLTTPLTVAQGGVGAATLTANNVLLGNGTGAVQVVAPSTSGNVLSSNGTTWVSSTLASSVPTVVLSARTSNTILGTADASKLIDITSGTFTQTFTAAATLGSGWFCYIRNSGTGDITLDPNASELIDGLTSYVMYTGETRLVQCTGTAFTSVVLTSFSKTYTANDTFTKPPGYQQFSALAWSGGGSGQRTNNATTVSVGGGGGGCGNFTVPAASLSATETVTIGAGGAAVTTVAGGNVGTNTTLGTLIKVYAGASAVSGGSVLGGLPTTTGVTDYEGGKAGTAPANSYWGGGASASNGSNPGGDCWYGAGAGGGLSNAAVANLPGTSVFGGNGGAALSASNGTAGSAPGGGGGATQTGTASGAGARGELRIWGTL